MTKEASKCQCVPLKICVANEARELRGVARSLSPLAAALLFIGTLLPASGFAQEPGCVPRDDHTGRGLPWPYSQFGCSILAQHDLGLLPDNPIYWFVDRYPNFHAAVQAKGERSSIIRLKDDTFLFTIAEDGWRPEQAGERLQQIGPLPVEKNKFYTAIYADSLTLRNQASGVAAFSGPLAWFVRWGEMCIETPSGKMTLEAGQSGVLRTPETPLNIVTISEATTSSRMGMALVETAKQSPSQPSDWTPPGACQAGYPAIAIRQRNDLSDDPSFATFMQRLRILVAQSDLSSLSELMGRNFFWEQDSHKEFERAVAPIKNFVRALHLNPSTRSRKGRNVERSWRRLQAMLTISSWASSTSRGGACGPAEPVYDRAELAAAQRRVKDLGAWAYPVGTVTVRQGTSPDSQPIGSVSNEMVQVLTFPIPAAGAPKISQIMLPNGRLGFVHGENRFWPLNSDQLCFQKEKGEWRISGYIGRN
jgi:hypothetical protein